MPSKLEQMRESIEAAAAAKKSGTKPPVVPTEPQPAVPEPAPKLPKKDKKPATAKPAETQKPAPPPQPMRLLPRLPHGSEFYYFYTADPTPEQPNKGFWTGTLIVPGCPQQFTTKVNGVAQLHGKLSAHYRKWQERNAPKEAPPCPTDG